MSKDRRRQPVSCRRRHHGDRSQLGRIRISGSGIGRCLIFDTPGLVEAARINPEKVALLRSAATVVHTVEELVSAAAAECISPQTPSVDAAVSHANMFHDPGRATDRASRPHPRGPRLHRVRRGDQSQARRYNQPLGGGLSWMGRDRHSSRPTIGRRFSTRLSPLWRGCACPRPSAGRQSLSTTIRPTTPEAVVEGHVSGFPVRLRYLVRSVHKDGRARSMPGSPGAEGGSARVHDDDVQVVDGWLDAAVRRTRQPAINQSRYSGGPVRPLWEAPPPVWLDLTRGDLWGTIAIEDHGADPFIYEEIGERCLWAPTWRPGANCSGRSAGSERTSVAPVAGWCSDRRSRNCFCGREGRGFAECMCRRWRCTITFRPNG